MENLTENILPHKKPMVLIDEISDYSLEENWLESFVTIREDNIFYDEKIKGVSSVVGIEYMAQTIGCFAYLKASLEKPKLGFLLGTRLYNNKIDKFSLNEKYKIRVHQIFSGDNIVSFECLIYNQEQDEIASATINVYQAQGDNDLTAGI